MTTPLERLQQLVDPLTRRAGRDVLREIAQPMKPETFEMDLAAAFVRAASDRAGELERLAEIHAATRRGVLDDAFAALLDELPGHPRGPRDWTDRSAIEDRIALARMRANQRVAILAQACHSEYVRLPESSQSDVLSRAGALATEATAPWWLREHALRLFSHAEESAQVLRRLLPSGEDPWVLATVVELLCEKMRDPRPLLATAMRPSGPEHFWARARIVRTAVLRGDTDLARQALITDPSEHVRAESARALAERAPSALAPLLRGDTGHSRVAFAAAVDGLLQHVHARDLTGLTLLRSALRAHDPDRLLLLLHACWRKFRAVEDRVLAQDVGKLWGEALDHLTQLEVGPDAHRLIRVLSAWVQVAQSRAHWAAYRRLAAWLLVAPEGSKNVFRGGPFAALTGRTLLNILFVLSQDDVDLSADARGLDPVSRPDAPAPRGWTVYVGLRASTAAWRVVHEARTPSNRKRSGFDHTTEDLPPGRLIAWSARMAEVSSTDVPSVRIASPQHLDWGEHLPLLTNARAAARRGDVVVRNPWGFWRIGVEGRGRFLGPRSVPKLASARERLRQARPQDGVVAWTDQLSQHGVHLRHLAVAPLAGVPDAAMGWIAAASLALFMGQNALRAATRRRWRQQIPLVVGGWGSRGKSSVERLKAALFHGTGWSVLCKSTGCEAMMLLAIPGRPATEVYLYRPGDKATIVEQLNILKLGAAMRPQVMLWECMALNPRYTRILQQGWMQDDFTTITNTYPDHEDIQGPSGRDVADAISSFAPKRGTLITSEQHMTPVLRRAADQAGSRFIDVGPLAFEQLPKDVLAAFPYTVHPRNVALVVRLAQQLGVPRDTALRAMCTNVLPDLGAFRALGPIQVKGRSLRYLNGNSANDRASFLSNWDRAQLDSVPMASGLGAQLVVMINNRADRLARQAMFAQIAARDVSCDMLVLIGTNVIPLRDQILSDLRGRVRTELVELGNAPGGRRRLATVFAERLRRRARSSSDAAMAAAAYNVGGLWTEQTQLWAEECSWLFALRKNPSWDVEVEVDRFLHFFAQRIVPFEDPNLQGDQIKAAVAERVPPGTQVDVLGCANIKGTGLDHVYKWVAAHDVAEALAALENPERRAASEALDRLTHIDNLGHFGALHAAEQLEALLETERFRALRMDARARAVANELRAYADEHPVDLDAEHKERGRSFLLKPLRDIRRRRHSDRLFDALGARTIGMSRAAAEARALVEDGRL